MKNEATNKKACIIYILTGIIILVSLIVGIVTIEEHKEGVTLKNVFTQLGLLRPLKGFSLEDKVTSDISETIFEKTDKSDVPWLGEIDNKYTGIEETETKITFPIHPIIIVSVIIALAIIFFSRLIKGKKPFKLNFKIDAEEAKFYKDLLRYFAWGFIQQLILAVVFFVLRITISTSCLHIFWIMTIATGLFGLVHAPNFLLMFSTMAMGFVLLQHSYVYHNLYLIGIIHGLLGNILKYFLPNWISTSFTVWKPHIKYYDKENN